MTAFSSSQPTDFPAGGAALPACPAEIPDTQEMRLIRHAQAGSTESFRLLVELHQEMIHRLCLKWLSCADDAGEACQDTFLKAWQALPAWEPRGRLRTWLYQIALNQCRDRVRSRAHRQRHLTVPLPALTTPPACPHPQPDAAAAHAGDMDKLGLGLSALPESARTVLILCGLEGLSHGEAATVLNCTPRAVEGRVHRARQLLMDWWTRHP